MIKTILEMNKIFQTFLGGKSSSLEEESVFLEELVFFMRVFRLAPVNQFEPIKINYFNTRQEENKTKFILKERIIYV